MKLHNIHAEFTALEGRISCLVNGKLAIFKFISPRYNDYGEYRIENIILSKNDYSKEVNNPSNVQLNPMENIEDIEISDDEFKLLEDLSFYFNSELDEETEENEVKFKTFIKRFEPVLNNDNLIVGGFLENNNELQIITNRNETINSNTLSTTEQISDDNGMYKILLPYLRESIKIWKEKFVITPKKELGE